MPAPDRVGQGTAVEMHRAVAEVQAAIIVAQQCPRKLAQVIEDMEEACRQPELAERAFFRYPRGGQIISGPSVHLARELARCWGNFQHGLVEMRRDDNAAQSEMQAWAWDVQTNSRNSHTFIVPHRRDTKDGPVTLIDMRDVYENNANQGARRVRETIYAELPVWFVERAKSLCMKTIEDGGGKPLAVRIAEAVKVFERFGVTPARMEAKIGRPQAEWTAFDVGQLGVIYESIRQGTVTVDDEFPQERVTADEIDGGGKAGAPAPAKQQERKLPEARQEPKAAAARAVRTPAPIAPGQLADLEAERTRLEFEDPAEWVATVARIALVPDLAEVGSLTAEQAQLALKAVKGKTRPEVTALVADAGQGTLDGAE